MIQLFRPILVLLNCNAICIRSLCGASGELATQVVWQFWDGKKNGSPGDKNGKWSLSRLSTAVYNFIKILFPLLAIARSSNCLAKTNGEVIITTRFPQFLVTFPDSLRRDSPRPRKMATERLCAIMLVRRTTSNFLNCSENKAKNLTNWHVQSQIVKC